MCGELYFDLGNFGEYMLSSLDLATCLCLYYFLAPKGRMLSLDFSFFKKSSYHTHSMVIVGNGKAHIDCAQLEILYSIHQNTDGKMETTVVI